MRTKVIYLGTKEESSGILEKEGIYYIYFDEYNETWYVYANQDNKRHIGTCHSKEYIDKYFITPAQLRENQINSILDD